MEATIINDHSDSAVSKSTSANEVSFKHKIEKIKLEGNNLVSYEEECVAKLLRMKNLEYANSIAAEVHPKNTIYTRFVKRVLDILISLPACILSLPLNIIFGVCTFFDVGYPIFYRQTRVGKGERLFTMIKFRSMNEKKDKNGVLLPAAQRVTKFGKLMRKFSLDELLNFWSVLKGDMSIIGPRPMPVFIYERMNDRHKQCISVKPGLECPRVVSVECKNGSMYQRSYENAIWYVENVSFMTDIKMLLLLIKMTLSLQKRSGQAQGASYFVGYDDEGDAISLRRYKELYMGNSIISNEE